MQNLASGNSAGVSLLSTTDGQGKLQPNTPPPRTSSAQSTPPISTRPSSSPTIRPGTMPRKKERRKHYILGRRSFIELIQAQAL
jgi:hypothetical protein